MSPEQRQAKLKAEIGSLKAEVKHLRDLVKIYVRTNARWQKMFSEMEPYLVTWLESLKK
jgi:hypothetical protein